MRLQVYPGTIGAGRTVRPAADAEATVAQPTVPPPAAAAKPPGAALSPQIPAASPGIPEVGAGQGVAMQRLRQALHHVTQEVRNIDQAAAQLQLERLEREIENAAVELLKIAPAYQHSLHKLKEAQKHAGELKGRDLAAAS